MSADGSTAYEQVSYQAHSSELEDSSHTALQETVAAGRPGTPPIGCVLDWFAFPWAETVIALCLIVVVATGVVRTALRTDDAPT